MKLFLQFLFVLYHLGDFLVVSGSSLAPALYVFGDSLFDSGNNNLLPTLARANFPPYGVNFSHGVTGRFTNGRTVPDFIAEFLGLPYPPPVLSIKKSCPVTGLNFASGSCGILPKTGKHLGKCLSLNDQINLFEATVKLKLSNSRHLSKSIFIFSIGSNDYLDYVDDSIFNLNKLQYSPERFAQLLLDKLSHSFQRLFNLGARKILMFEIGPIGCLPSVTRKQTNRLNNGKCVEAANQKVQIFNKKLGAMLQRLTATLHGSTFVYGHAYWLGYDAIINPSKYELSESSSACCTTWANGTSGCIPFTPPCPSPNNNYFYDAFHLTETVCKTIASHCISDRLVCSPTLNELVKI